MLPGSSFEAPLNSLHLSTEENTIVEETAVSARASTTVSSSVQETTVVSEQSSVTPRHLEVSPDCQVLSIPVLEPTTLPMISSIPNTLAINTELAVTVLPGLSLNEQVIASEDLDNTASLESQNDQVTHPEPVAVITETNGSEMR